MTGTLDIAILGLSLRSAWGNGHATTYRALLHALLRRGLRRYLLDVASAWPGGRFAVAEHTADHRVQTLERYIDRAVPRRGVARSNRSICHDSA